MTDNRTTSEGKVSSRRRAALPPTAETSLAQLEALAADLVQRLGPVKAKLLATLIDEAADAAETR